MRTFFLSLSSLVFLASCSTYEYVKIDSPSMTKNTNNELVWENDTVRMVYNFHGKNGPMKLSLFNKTNKPLFINWKESALIRDSESISLYDAHIYLTGDGSSTTVNLTRNLAIGSSSFSAAGTLPEGMDMVAPASYIHKDLFQVWSGKKMLDSVTLAPLPEQKITDDEHTVKYKTMAYGNAQSPGQFRAYLTFVLGNDGKESFVISQPFHISEVMRAACRPKDFAPYGTLGDHFYVKE